MSDKDLNVTPGEWRAGQDGDEWIVYKDVGIQPHIARVVEAFTDRQTEANAKLISASKELYAALDRIVSDHHNVNMGFKTTSHALRQANAALAKARGEATDV